MAGFDFAAYPEHRKQLGATRLARGWSKPPAQTIGTGRLKLQIGSKVPESGTSLPDMAKKSKCANCGRVGHWWRACPFPPDERAKARAKLQSVQRNQFEQAAPAPTPVPDGAVFGGFFYGNSDPPPR